MKGIDIKNDLGINLIEIVSKLDDEKIFENDNGACYEPTLDFDIDFAHDLSFEILDGFNNDFVNENFDEKFDMIEFVNNHDDKILLHEDLIIDEFVNKFVDNDVYHDFDMILIRLIHPQLILILMNSTLNMINSLSLMTMMRLLIRKNTFLSLTTISK